MTPDSDMLSIIVKEVREVWLNAESPIETSEFLPACS